MALASYTFLPWLRQGLATSIAETESAANPTLRASIAVQVTLRSEGVSAPVADEPLDRAVRLIGPGDILGIDPKAIIKSDPRDWITNHEPNYLAHIDFYDEDFPWRYTPARADAGSHRHRPWIALVALEEGEFTEGKLQGQPLPYFELDDRARLPPIAELWAWAHVHVNRNLGNSETVVVNDDAATIVTKLRETLAANRDLAYSRILSPRRLVPNKPYHAFLVPTFETGRVAGLGLDLGKVDDAMRGAWEDHPERAGLAPNRYPYYHRWYFRTGEAADFECLVRLLVPQPMDPRVGQRDLDVQRPAVNLAGITGPNGDGVLRLGGALKIPDDSLDDAQRAEAERFERWDQPQPHPFQRALAAYINLADDYAGQSPAQAHQRPEVPTTLGRLPDGRPDPDPLITPPLYGRWHALTGRLLVDAGGHPVPNANNWVHQLNLDPRHRVAAGLGTSVVRDRQEEFVEAAWAQVGQVLEANREIRGAQLSVAVSMSWFERSIASLGRTAPDRLLALSAPVLQRVVTDGLTIRKRLARSPIPVAMVGTAMRRMLRPAGRLATRLVPGAARTRLSAGLLERLNDGRLATAQAPAIPPGAASAGGVATTLLPSAPAWLIRLLRRYPGAPLAVLLVLAAIALLLLFIAGPLAAAGAAALAIVAYRWLRRLAADIARADAVLPDRETPAVVDAMPPHADYTVQPFGADSAEAVRFKEAWRDALQQSADATAATRPPPRVRVDLAATSTAVVEAVHPAHTIPRRLYRKVRLPGRIKDALVDDFVEVMAYPRIDEPMYRPLVALGTDLFLPNLGLIPQNSISLLETNQRFIESYLVGVNHEFARELLWREYPTDQRGSTFRQFWDVAGYRDQARLDAEALREKLYDIPELHRWRANSRLGDHDHRQPPGSAPRDEVVLAIRGELLKRYPTAVIYAHRAEWQRTRGVIDKSKIRVLTPLTAAEETDPPRTKLKTPLYEAKVDPDITFFGFDLTVREAKGDPSRDDAGWFFVIKERPGEPRFGLDIERTAGTPINTWSDLAWNDVTVEDDLVRVRPGMRTHLLTVPPPSSEGPEELAQHLEDRQLRWDDRSNAADLAYILYQLPVLVAVHAAEMLPPR